MHEIFRVRHLGKGRPKAGSCYALEVRTVTHRGKHGGWHLVTYRADNDPKATKSSLLKLAEGMNVHWQRHFSASQMILDGTSVVFPALGESKL